jgi:hypothetical protein
MRHSVTNHAPSPTTQTTRSIGDRVCRNQRSRLTVVGASQPTYCRSLSKNWGVLNPTLSCAWVEARWRYLPLVICKEEGTVRKASALWLKPAIGVSRPSSSHRLA